MSPFRVGRRLVTEKKFTVADGLLLLVNVIMNGARIGNVVIIWREPPPDRSRDGSQVSQESRWYLDNSTEERASILQRRSEFKIGSVGVSSHGDGFFTGQTPESLMQASLR